MSNYQINQIGWLVTFLFFGAAAHANTIGLPDTETISPRQTNTVVNEIVHRKDDPLLEVSEYKISDRTKDSLLESIETVEQYDTIIDRAIANTGEVDVKEVKSIILAESQGNPQAYNKRTDAQGLGQITPVAFKEIQERFGDARPTDRFNPEDNIKMVVQTLWLLEHHYGITDPLERICAYNEGAGGAKKYRESFNDHLYVQKVAFGYKNI